MHACCVFPVEDSKCGYPAACNAMETLLVHKDLFNSELYHNILQLLSNEKVRSYVYIMVSKSICDKLHCTYIL